MCSDTLLQQEKINFDIFFLRETEATEECKGVETARLTSQNKCNGGRYHNLKNRTYENGSNLRLFGSPGVLKLCISLISQA